MADINKGFGERLRALIKKEGITQKGLASKLGITPSALTFHLNGQVPSSRLLVKYAEHFCVSVDYLLTGKGAKTAEDEGALQLPEKSPFYSIMADILNMPKSRQTIIRDILRVIVDSEKKQSAHDPSEKPITR